MKRSVEAKETGITLIALVVTIVVLFILAGITIVYVFGDNGVFKLAQEAKNKTEEAMQNEQEYMSQIGDKINEYVNGNGGGITNPSIPDDSTEPVEVPIENIKADWETIEKIAKAIADDDSITSDSTEAKVTIDGKIYTITVGDLFEVEYNGEVRRVRVLGFKHDDLVNTGVYGGNHSKASISFEFYDFMTGDSYMPMNSSATNIGGWASTKLRTDLNGSGTGIGGLGANLSNKEYIKQVKKKYIATYDDTSSVTTCNDYLWLLASSEIVNSGYQSGYYGYAVTSEGSQYQYYKGVTEEYDQTSMGRVKYNASESAFNWWLRSPTCGNISYFCFTSSGGDVNNSYKADTSYGISPGFCI